MKYTIITATAASLLLAGCSGISVVETDTHRMISARDVGGHVTVTGQWLYSKVRGEWVLNGTHGSTTRGVVQGPAEAALGGAVGAIGAGALISKGLGDVEANPTVNTDVTVNPPGP